jgi:hypothetical protein
MGPPGPCSSRSGSRYSMSRTCGPRDIISLVIPKFFDYLVNTRLDICFVVNTLNRFTVDLRQVHWVAVKHVLRYLRGTMEYGMRYLGGDGVRLQGYTDLDWAGSAGDRKNTSRCCFSLGSTVISWFNRKQTSVAFNSAEEEYMATSIASCEAIWLRKLIT